MRILLALGNPKDTGGPTGYARELRREFGEMGHTVKFLPYGEWMWRLPSGVRHGLYAAKLFAAALRSDVIIAFDTMTVGVPALAASTLTGRPLLVRIGGDFLWEEYVERTGDLVKFSDFYARSRSAWSIKEKIIFSLTHRVVCRADCLFFNSDFQKDAWQKVYGFRPERAQKLENRYPERVEGGAPSSRVVVCAGRGMLLKQADKLKKIVGELAAEYPDLSVDTRELPAPEHQKRVANAWAVAVVSVSEMSPNAVIDALTYGKPFICTADTGIRERLEGTGLFVDTADTAEIRSAIRLLCDEEEYAKIAARVQGFRFVRTWEDIAREILSVAEKLCA